MRGSPWKLRRSAGSAATSSPQSGASAFAYSDAGATTVHPLLDPRGASRESRDSAEHPQSLAIAVLFDVTGSMRQVPRALQAKLPQLLGLVLRHGYAGHPHIMFGAIGDATCDRAPLQVGQFEYDNRMDGDLGRIIDLGPSVRRQAGPDAFRARFRRIGAHPGPPWLGRLAQWPVGRTSILDVGPRSGRVVS